ncbi:ankyrin repeat domain-containing protein [Wolbachia endosymbiont (group A) of Colletes cunicularius]|uniref:ankyrin repeat domain-containing protein n=1 Tax=Wolbachia endosymbiont (group A) of Colletes cunicularius TaxID=3139321 RepID=UPI0035C87FC8
MNLFKDIFPFLSDKETIINTKDSGDWTPLHYAVYYNALDVVKFLVNKGADINAKDKDSKTPLDLAAQENDKSVAEFLKQKELDKKLLAAVQDAGLNEVKDLINQKANINAKDMYGWTPLHFAASRDKLSVVEFLFNNNANVKTKDVYGNTPLHVAAQYSSNLEIVKFLLDKDVSGINDITNNGWTPLHLAIQGNKLNTVELLLDRGADIEVRDIYNQTSLDLATRKGYLDIAGILKQVQLDRKLLTIVESGGFNEAKGLIAQGANVDTKDKDGNTLLYSAAEIGDLNPVKLLLDNGANIEAKNGEYQATPLHGAVENYRIDVVKLLLNRGANVNAEDKDNWTPLHYAADTNSLDIVKVLVDAHASLDARGDYGKTPLDVARDKGHNNIVNCLEEELNKERGKPLQRKRRHHHGDHDRHHGHLSHKPLAIDSSNQPEMAASSCTRPSSWINNLLGWVKSSVGGLLGSRAALPEVSANYSNTAKNPDNQYTSQFSSEVCISNNVGLGFFLIQSFLDKKYPLPKFCSVTPEEALASTLNITKKFEQILREIAKQSNMSVKDVNFFKVYSDIAGHVRNERYSQIPNTLYSVAKEVCPKNEKFLSILKGNIEKMFDEQQIVNSGYQVQTPN